MSLFGSRISTFFGGTTSGGGGGGVGGSGTTNYVAKWTTSTDIGNSSIFDNGTSVGIGTNTPVSTYKLDVVGNIFSSGFLKAGLYTTLSSAGTSGALSLNSSTETLKMLFGNGGVGIADFVVYDGNYMRFRYQSPTNVPLPTKLISAETLINYSSGTNSHTIFGAVPTMNTSGGTNTIRGFYYAPSITSDTGNTHVAFQNTIGDIIFGNLSGSGTQMVVTDNSGKLGIQALPVPYSGATTNVNLGEYGLTTGYVQFDTTPTTYTPAVGNIGWNATDGTLEFQLVGGNVTLQVGQEQVVYVKNVDSSPIVDGEAVYIFGASGDRPSVKKASNSSATTSSRTIGIATESIAVNGFGFITVQGLVHGLNTNAFNNGDQLWVGTTAGSIVNTKPASPLYSVFIGVCVKKSGGDGHIYVYPQVGFNLDELNDVNTPSPSNNDGLFYNSTSLVWENKSIATALGYTPVQSVGGTSPIVSSGGTTPSISIPQATGSANGYLSSNDWTLFSNQIILTAIQSLGSTFKSQSLSVLSIMGITTSTAIADGGLRFFAVYLPIAATITGVKWYQGTQGDYTADNYNGVGLYTYNAGTLTQVASSTNDGNIWKGTTNTWQTKAFSSTYSASAGIYFIAMLYNSSAQVTAPSIGSAPNSANSIVSINDFTNSAKISGVISAQASLPSPTQAMSGVTASNVNLGFWLY